MARILVIDDDRLLRGTVEVILTSDGHDVAAARDGREGLGRLRSDSFDLVACDVFMPNREGLDTVRAIRAVCASVPIIAFTGGPGYDADPAFEAELRRAAGLGAMETLQKPFRRQELLALVRRCLDGAGAS